MVLFGAHTVALFDEWITHRGSHRLFSHPSDGHLADFVLCNRERRLGEHRLPAGLQHAVADAALTGPSGEPLRVTLHQLHHTFGTSLVNSGVSRPALVALLGEVTSVMTMHRARVAPLTIRDAYNGLNAAQSAGGEAP